MAIAKRPLPPIHELRRRLAYRSDGVLIWKQPLGKKIKPGHKAGTISHRGYLYLKLNYRRFACHRVIWAILKQEDPLNFDIDHINGDTSDNRIENLRKATHRQNHSNRRRVKGYSFNKIKQKWLARITFNGKYFFLGYFKTEEQAREAYLRAKEKLHGDFMPENMKHELSIIDQPTSQLDFFND
jgi:hypothetical protein